MFSELNLIFTLCCIICGWPLKVQVPLGTGAGWQGGRVEKTCSPTYHLFGGENCSANGDRDFRIAPVEDGNYPKIARCGESFRNKSALRLNVWHSGVLCFRLR